MKSNLICMLITIIAYLILMIVVGILASKKNKDTSDFYLGGRKLGPIVTAMSAEASDMSGYLLMGLPGLALLTGFADVGWTVIGLAIGTYLNWLFVAKRLRIYSQHNGSITIPDFFSNRYHDNKHFLMGISAIIILIFFVPYTASGFSACGKLFQTLFGMNYHAAMILSAVIIIAYTSIGGFLAASTTDLLQSIIMTVALVMVVVFGIVKAGGIDVVMENAKALPGYLSFNHTYDITTNSAKPYNILTICSTLAWGLGYFGMPHILLRFMAIEDSKKIKTSRRIASIWVVISMFIAVCIGVIGYSVSAAGKVPFLATSAESETIIIKLADLMSQHGVLLAIMAGIILSGILAATMSTADSQLLAAASSVSQDLMQHSFGMKMNQRTTMLAARTTVICIALIGMVLAWDPNSSVFRVVSFAWAGFGAAFGPVMLFSLFWKRANKQGALAGMITGGAVVFIWKYLIAPMGGAWAIYELLPAFLAACIAIVAVSLVTPAPEKAVTDTFDEICGK